ncbi:MAG: MCE family protein [Phycisphaerales bacterium]|nr:MAG: MCE family protein [Phycisphaerales bacterium]
MGIKANYLKIGVFVILMFALLTAGVIFWGADRFRQEKYFVETYIDQSVQGLTVGSPIYSRGVHVGEVANIAFVTAIYDLSEGSEEWRKYGGYVYVLISLTHDRLLAKADPGESLEAMIAEGLRLRINSNPLTGSAFLQGDRVDPSEYPPLPIGWEPKHVHIPWVPSVLSEFVTELETVMERIKGLDIEGLVGNANQLLVDLDQAVLDARVAVLSSRVETVLTNADTTITDLNSMVRVTETAEAPTTLEDILNHVDKTITTLDQAVSDADVGGISGEGKQLLAELRDSNRKLQALLRSTDTAKPPAAIDQVLAEVDTAVRQLNLLMKQYRPNVYTTLSNVAATSENLKETTEDVKRQPSKLLFSHPPTHSEVLE